MTQRYVLSGSTPTANLLTGLHLDEYFQRTDLSGPANFLTDALGSTIALTGTGGNTLAQYTYDPFGNTTLTGSSANPYQYTGRENDGTGLYYYRGRYYHPSRGRFISEDPAGFAGGINLYAYVGNSPVSFRDPFGYGSSGEPPPPPGGCIGGGNGGGGSVGTSGGMRTGCGGGGPHCRTIVCGVGALGGATLYSGGVMRYRWLQIGLGSFRRVA
jgi:RHS repeat-associated protein